MKPGEGLIFPAGNNQLWILEMCVPAFPAFCWVQGKGWAALEAAEVNSEKGVF